jgi:hypothetical protein
MMKKLNEYEQQAQDFLNQTNSKLEVRFIKHDKYFVSDKEERDIFEVKLTRDSREYIFQFGASIADYEKLLEYTLGEDYNRYDINALISERYMPNSIQYTKQKKFNKMREAMSNWNTAGENNTPTAYSVLACLEGYCYSNNVDDFASEYGYTKPSEAIEVFEAVKKQASELQKLYNDKELEMLSEVN